MRLWRRVGVHLKRRGNNITLVPTSLRLLSPIIIGTKGCRRRTFRFPPVIVTLTNRLVYCRRFLARPFGVFFFSWGSTYITSSPPSQPKICSCFRIFNHICLYIYLSNFPLYLAIKPQILEFVTRTTVLRIEVRETVFREPCTESEKWAKNWP